MKRITTWNIAASLMMGFAFTAQAGVILPNAIEINFNGITAFDTSADPVINVATGDLFSIPGGVVNLTAVGEVTVIHDSADVDNKGTPAADMTFVLEAVLTPNGNATELNSGDPDVRTYLLGSTLTGGTLKVYDDDLSGGTQNFVTSDVIGGPLSIPASATDGNLYIDADLSGSTGLASLIVSYSRPDGASDFDSIALQLQTLLTNGYSIIDGTILNDIANAAGSRINASQSGPGAFSVFPTDSIDLGGGNIVTVNVPIDEYIEGTFSSEFVPEPHTLLLVGAGAMGMLIRRRR